MEIPLDFNHASYASVLSFRYIGFVPKEEVVDNRKVVNVQMVEDVGQLDEVVVVAYGAQKKESVVFVLQYLYSMLQYSMFE